MNQRVSSVVAWAGLLMLCAGSARAQPFNLKETELVASDGVSFDQMGAAVALSGSTAVVGAEGDSSHGSSPGAVYVFVRSGDAWSLQQKVTAPDGAPGDAFGHAVAISDDTMVVGAYGDDHKTDLSGSAYVFVRSGASWTLQQKLYASDALSGDQFGAAVSISGDVALIGCFQRDDLGTSSGAAYVFERSGTSWTQTQKLLASDGMMFAQFGAALALDGSTALIGAYGDSATAQSAGAAYVFVRGTNGFAEVQKLVAADAVAQDFFGISVALSANTAVIGAFGRDDNGSGAGAAYVFTRNTGQFSQAQKLLAGDGVADDIFGYAVAVSGNIALIGAYQRDDKGQDSGAAYLFVSNGGAFTQRQKLTASDGSDFQWFGNAVALGSGMGIVAVIGAYGDGTRGPFAGAAYVMAEKERPLVAALGPAGGFGLGFGLLMMGLARSARFTRSRRSAR